MVVPIWLSTTFAQPALTSPNHLIRKEEEAEEKKEIENRGKTKAELKASRSKF